MEGEGPVGSILFHLGPWGFFTSMRLVWLNCFAAHHPPGEPLRLECSGVAVRPPACVLLWMRTAQYGSEVLSRSVSSLHTTPRRLVATMHFTVSVPAGRGQVQEGAAGGHIPGREAQPSNEAWMVVEKRGPGPFPRGCDQHYGLKLLSQQGRPASHRPSHPAAVRGFGTGLTFRACSS